MKERIRIRYYTLCTIRWDFFAKLKIEVGEMEIVVGNIVST